MFVLAKKLSYSISTLLKQSRFKVIFFLELTKNGRKDKTFLLLPKVCQVGAVCHQGEAIYMYKIKKKNPHKVKLTTNEMTKTCNKTSEGGSGVSDPGMKAVGAPLMMSQQYFTFH